MRVSHRREPLNRQREPLNLQDPEKVMNQKVGSSKTVPLIEGSRHSTINSSASENEGMNITFYNAKSSCFPPIAKCVN
jgi:hypothetical protein